MFPLLFWCLLKYFLQVYVWGLNDKDQLGGVKGSKVKVPVFSPTLSALRPVHIAGGSKTLFIVSHDGKVSSHLIIIPSDQIYVPVKIIALNNMKSIFHYVYYNKRT